MKIFETWLWSFLGIVIESLPFILIGAIVSAIIQFYLSEEFVKKLVYKNKFIGYMGALFSGLLFPICECAIVPIARSLIKKGLPVGIGITFMLAVPILNPVVIMSTYYAFPNNLDVVIIRTLGGMLVALLVGIVIESIYKNKKVDNIVKGDTDLIGCDCCKINNKLYVPIFNKIINLINHASSEFLNISIYFIFGAFISSVFGVMISNEALSSISYNKAIGIILMMILSFALSLCSEADAFVAKGFLGNFGTIGVSVFLILGPMMDLKNTFLCYGLFKRKFVNRLILVIVSSVTLLATLLILIGY